MLWPGVSSHNHCTWRNKPRRGCCWWRPGNIWGGIIPHPAFELGLTAGPGFRGGRLLCGSLRQAVGRAHLRTCGRCKSGGRYGSGVCRIRDDVGFVHGANEELHEEPAWPAVVASRLVQACNLVVLVHGSLVNATKGKVRIPWGRIFMQNCISCMISHWNQRYLSLTGKIIVVKMLLLSQFAHLR